MSDAADPLHRPFRPRAARLVCLLLAALSLAMMVGLAAGLPALTGVRLGAGDRIGFVGLGAVMAWFLLLEAGVRAVPGPDGLVVRNLVRTRRLAWAEIVSVRFGPDRPWVLLDLADGDTLAVMAVQRADGDRARADARRLATLVALHSGTAHDD